MFEGEEFDWKEMLPHSKSDVNEGPLDGVVHLERNPDRVVGYTIKFLAQSEPFGRPTHRGQTFAPPMPPDDWRFVFTKGTAVT